MKKRKSISLGIVINILAFIILKGIAVFTSPYITKVLSTADYGDMSAYNTWAGIVCILAGLGTHSGLTNYKVNSDSADYNKYCWHSLMIGIFTHIVFFAGALLFRRSISAFFELPAWTVPLIVISAFCQYTVSFFSGYLILETEAAKNLVLSLFTTVGGFLLAVFILNNVPAIHGYQYMAFAIGYTLTNLVATVIAIIYFFVKGKCGLNRDYTFFALKMGIPIVFHLLSATVISNSDRLMIKKIADSGDSGTYSFAYTFSGIIYSVWAAVNSIWMPFYYSYMKDDDKAGLYERRKNFDILYGILVSGFLMVYPEVYRLLADKKFWVSIDLVPIVVLAFVFNHLYSFPQGYETYKENTVYIAVGTMISAFVNLILNGIFIPVCGGFGAAMATLVSYVSLYLFHRLMAQKVIGDYPLTRYKDYLFFAFCSCSVCLYYVFQSMWVVRWCIATVAGVFLLVRVLDKRSII